jgi:Fe-S-cluster containining protein
VRGEEIESMSQTLCKRCGTCCSKGGPALHLEDLPLLVQGAIDREALVTLRKGEPVHDNVSGALILLPEEIVKIRWKGSSWTCSFHNEEQRSCSIYASRPIECRALACWDTREIAKVYFRGRLTRRNILHTPSALSEIVAMHEEQCPVGHLDENARRILESGGGDAQAMECVSSLLARDASIREFLIKRTGASREALEFLLGRSLERILPMFGLRVDRVEGKMSLIRDNSYLEESSRFHRSSSSVVTSEA